jgi:hypothetical protein
MANRAVVLGGYMDDLLSRRHRILVALDAERPRVRRQQLGKIAPMSTVAVCAILRGFMRMTLSKSPGHVVVARTAKRFLVRHQQRSLIRGMGVVALEAFPFRRGKVLRAVTGE